MLPDGFNATYKCQNHPDRDAVAPIAARRCKECNDEAVLAYIDAMILSDMEIRQEGQPEHDRDTRGNALHADARRHYSKVASKRAKAKV